MVFYIIDNIKQQNQEVIKQIQKYVGLMALIFILAGGLFDILECLLTMCKVVVKIFLYIRKRCMRKNNDD